MSSPLSDVQQIYTDNPGSLAAEYDLTSDISVQSIVARIDGSGAAAAFLPTLSLYSQDGKLIARVPSDITYAVGDTGVVTWSPFLARRIRSILDLPVVGAAVHRPLANPQVIGSSNIVFTTITWTDVDFDTGGLFSGGQPTRITPQQAGLYVLIASVGMVAGAGGDRACQILKNGATQLVISESPAPGTYFYSGVVACATLMAVGDYLEVQGIQNSGAGLNTGACFLSCLGFGQA